MMLERETIRARKQRQRFPDRRYYSAEQGFADSQTEDSVAQSGTNQSPTKQNSAQQSGYSSKSSISDGDFVRFKEHVATNGGTKQAVGRDFVEKGRHTTPPSSPPMTVLLQNGQGKPTCQPSSPVTADLFNAAKSLEFGSLGPFSLGLPSTSTQFEEEFPALPTRKRAEGPISVAPSAKAVQTKSRYSFPSHSVDFFMQSVHCSALLLGTCSSCCCSLRPHQVCSFVVSEVIRAKKSP
jgi:hypothetical protein